MNRMGNEFSTWRQDRMATRLAGLAHRGKKSECDAWLETPTAMHAAAVACSMPLCIGLRATFENRAAHLALLALQLIQPHRQAHAGVHRGQQCGILQHRGRQGSPARLRSGVAQLLWDIWRSATRKQQKRPGKCGLQSLQARHGHLSCSPAGTRVALHASAQWQPNSMEPNLIEWPVPNDKPIHWANWLLTRGNSGGSSRFMALSSARKRAFSLGVTCQQKKGTRSSDE